jgi:MerR family mercuric resistance operon transcriptional regulator
MEHFETMGVGELAARSGVKSETVRYYEKACLMPEPPRSPGGHRLYRREHLKRLSFIRRARELGFPIRQVRELLNFIDEPSHTCGEVKGMAMRQAREVQRKIDDLQRLRDALNQMAARCNGGGYSIENCPIIDALFDGG